jgi:hypothetical protein
MTLLAILTHSAAVAAGLLLRELWRLAVKPLLLALINRV